MSWIEDKFHNFTVPAGDFTNIWNFIGIFDGTVVTHDPFCVTAVAYFPLGYMKSVPLWEKQMNELLRSFTSVPHGTVLNVYLLKFFEEPNIQAVGKSKWDLLNFLERKRLEKINKEKVPTYLPFVAITIPVEVKYEKRENPIRNWMQKKEFLAHMMKAKDAGTMDALNTLLTNSKHAKAFRDSIGLLQDLLEQIRVKFSGGCQRLDSEQVISFLSCMLNHTEHRPVMGLPSLFGGDIFTDSKRGVIEYGGQLHATVSARTKDLPKEISGDFPWLYYEESLRKVPFNIQATIRFPASDKARNDAQIVINRIDMAGGIFAPFKKMLAYQRDQQQMALDALTECNGRLLDVNYVIATWADDEDTLETNFSALRNVLRGREMGLSRDTYNLKAAFHGQVPWVSYRNKISTRLTSMNVEVMLPTLYPPVYPREMGGYQIKEPIWFHTHFDQLTCIEAFDRSCPVWNGVVVGTSGTGKSFTCNYLGINATQYNSKLFIIDKGGEGAGSYQNLIKNLGGTYVEINFKSKNGFSVNPFDGPLFWDFIIKGEDEDGNPIEESVPALDGKVAADKIALLLSILTMMICENEEDRLGKDQEEFLQALLEQGYRDTNNNEGNKFTVSDFANKYLLPLIESPREIRSIRMKDVEQWSRDFYNKMSKYINDGIYAHFFRMTSKLESDDIFCFDMEGVDEHPDLKGIITAIIVNFCYSMSMDGNPGRKKLILIDEAWAMLKGGKMTSVIENIWRTIRKHGGRIYCATQDFEAIINSPAGLAIMNNSTYYFMQGSKYKWETLQQVQATGKNGVNQLDRFDFERIIKNQFVPPKFAEFFFMNPVFKGQLRLCPSGWDYQLSTTDADDKARQLSYKRKHHETYLTPAILEELMAGKG